MHLRNSIPCQQHHVPDLHRADTLSHLLCVSEIIFCCGIQRRSPEADGVKRSHLVIFKSCLKMCHKTLCLLSIHISWHSDPFVSWIVWLLLASPCPGSIICLPPSRSGPGMMTSNHALIHKCDDTPSPLLFSNMPTHISTRTSTAFLDGERHALAICCICCMVLYGLPDRVSVSKIMQICLIAPYWTSLLCPLSTRVLALTFLAP